MQSIIVIFLCISLSNSVFITTLGFKLIYSAMMKVLIVIYNEHIILYVILDILHVYRHYCMLLYVTSTLSL